MNKKFLITGLVIGFLIPVIILISFKFYKSKQHLINNLKTPIHNPVIVPPYYEKKFFQKPPEIKQTQPISQIKLPIIMYHYVEYIKNLEDVVVKRLDINPAVFEKQLATLKENGYQTYFVKDIPEILDGKIKISSKSAVLTFDDGYEDFYTIVFPLLKKYQMKATIYIIYDFIGRKGFLNKTQIEEIAKSNLVEIGSHTLDHVYLKQSPETVARKQIFESKKRLEEMLGFDIKTFAYPYGAFNQKTIELVKEASYSAAVSVISGTHQSKENLFYLSRVRADAFTGAYMIRILEKFKK